jgi:hypothetical protein
MRESEKILKILEELKEVLFTKYKVKKVGLFGSYIKEEQKESSDIDVLVDFSEDADLIDLVGLVLFLEEKLRRKVDVVSEAALREELKEPILREVVYI